ncbi:MAG: DUF3459 domain-containing protein [Burkholderiales bacterium]|nr:DUF3459 domain-containing protein [Burkholderiales bacterium]
MRSGGTFAVDGDDVLRVDWTLGDASRLHLIANLTGEPRGAVGAPPGEVVCATGFAAAGDLAVGVLPAWTAAVTLERTA